MIPPIPWPGQKTNFTGRLRALAEILPPDITIYFPFGGSGVDCYTIKRANPRLKIIYNDGSNYLELYNNLQKIERLREKICKDRLPKERAALLAENILPGRGGEIINCLKIRGYTEGWRFWCRGTELSPEPNYFAGIIRRRKIFRDYNDICGVPADLYIIDPPYSRLGQAEQSYLTINGDFPTFARRLTRPAVIFYDRKIPGYYTIATSAKLHSDQYMMVNDPAGKLGLRRRLG